MRFHTNKATNNNASKISFTSLIHLLISLPGSDQLISSFHVLSLAVSFAVKVRLLKPRKITTQQFISKIFSATIYNIFDR